MSHARHAKETSEGKFILLRLIAGILKPVLELQTKSWYRPQDSCPRTRARHKIGDSELKSCEHRHSQSIERP